MITNLVQDYPEPTRTKIYKKSSTQGGNWAEARGRKKEFLCMRVATLGDLNHVNVLLLKEIKCKRSTESLIYSTSLKKYITSNSTFQLGRSLEIRGYKSTCFKVWKTPPVKESRALLRS